MRILLSLSLTLLASACSGKVGDATNPLVTTPATNLNGSNSASVLLQWNASTGSPSTYLIEESLDGNLYSQISAVPSSQTSFTVTGLSKGSTYFFRLRSHNANGDSAYTSIVTATP